MESRVAFFLGGMCKQAYLVDVPVLAGQKRIYTQEDLDVYLWLPNAPFVIKNVTDLESNRTFYEYDAGNGEEIVKFCCIHFDQVFSEIFPLFHF